MADGLNLAQQLNYLSGFGNEHASEALPGALPIGRSSPQRPPYGLYAEKFSGTAFTAPRDRNLRSWFYRIRPAVTWGRFEPAPAAFPLLRTAPILDAPPLLCQARWDPFPIPEKPTDFLDGLTTILANGDPRVQVGMAAHIYVANASMTERFFFNADGEMLIVPQQGALRLHTEFGRLDAAPGDVACIPRGAVFRVELLDAQARGYVCENYGAALRLPERGPVGSDGYANDRDFLFPTAAYEDSDQACEVFAKMNGAIAVAQSDHSPLDVVAWYGRYAPYKYELARFNVINTVSYDHPDPSIFTVLTSPTDTPGVANVDFVIFPSRWMVAQDTFRPPWYHRNVMSEFMGLIHGQYDAKPAGFVPGGMSLHNSMLPHGPDYEAFEKATGADLKPHYLDAGLAFMFESRYPMQPTRAAMEAPQVQAGYPALWSQLQRRFTPNKR